MPLDARERSETVKNYMQILAIIVAAIWTVYIFSQKEVPLLERRAEANSDLRWEKTNTSDKCKAIFNVGFENKGTTSFDISRVRIRGWRFSITKQDNDLATYLELNEVLGGGKPFTDKSYTTSGKTPEADLLLPFVGHYPSGAKYHHTFEWEVKRVPNQWVFFRADFYRGNEIRSNWYTGSWSAICTGLTNEKP